MIWKKLDCKFSPCYYLAAEVDTVSEWHPCHIKRRNSDARSHIFYLFLTEKIMVYKEKYNNVNDDPDLSNMYDSSYSKPRYKVLWELEDFLFRNFSHLFYVSCSLL